MLVHGKTPSQGSPPDCWQRPEVGVADCLGHGPAARAPIRCTPAALGQMVHHLNKMLGITQVACCLTTCMLQRCPPSTPEDSLTDRAFDWSVAWSLDQALCYPAVSRTRPLHPPPSWHLGLATKSSIKPQVDTLVMSGANLHPERGDWGTKAAQPCTEKNCGVDSREWSVLKGLGLLFTTLRDSRYLSQNGLKHQPVHTCGLPCFVSHQ